MQTQTTDTCELPRRYRTWLPLTGLTDHQFRSVFTLIGHKVVPPARGRRWSMPLTVRVLLVLIHLRTNLTTRALAALFATSQTTVDRIIHHLVPVLARILRPTPDFSRHPWIIDGTLIPVHDQSLTAISKNYRRSVNTQILINAQRRTVIEVGRCWPGNRNDVVVAQHTVAHLLDGTRPILGDGGYRGISTITGPRRGPDGRIIRDHHYRDHRRIRARVEPSSPDSKTGRCSGNADAAATPSTTASTSSQGYGTSRHADNYGSTLRHVRTVVPQRESHMPTNRVRHYPSFHNIDL